MVSGLVQLPAIELTEALSFQLDTQPSPLPYGNVTIPFVDLFPKGEIYDLLTTRPEDLKNE